MISPTSAENYTIIVGVDASPASFKAVDYAADLVKKLSVDYKLLVVYVTALNRTSRLPYFDHLDKAYNIEIQDEATSATDSCKSYLKKYDGEIVYEFIVVEGEGEVGPILEKYIEDTVPECKMVVVGSKNMSGLKR
ncbi:hypothetical protein BKA69DRAFT_471305 [Paraphysoderma sedebokerense]|nr:hypothetical protein BKA69DRAFT_471305 [Paraphysoderma sedebokerense]